MGVAGVCSLTLTWQLLIKVILKKLSSGQVLPPEELHDTTADEQFCSPYDLSVNRLV
jgi:hypothetical protein